MTGFLETKDYCTTLISLVVHGESFGKIVKEHLLLLLGANKSLDLTPEVSNGLVLLDFLGCTSWSPCEGEFL